MRRVSTPQSRARARRRGKAIDRRQKRRSGRVRIRHVPTYGLLLTVWPAHLWNANPQRVELGDPEAPADHTVLVADCIPVDENLPDEGVVAVVTLVPDASLREGVSYAIQHVHQMMDAKHGSLGWLPGVDAVIVHDERPSTN